MRLSVYKSFEPALLGRVLRHWNERVPLFAAIEVHGPALLSWGLRAEPAQDELRVFLLDPPGLRAALAEGVPPALQATGGRAPLLVLCPDPERDGERAPEPELLSLARCERMDGAALAKAAGVGRIGDPESRRIAGVPYADGFYLAIGTALFRRAHALLRPEPKLIAVDCDGTLWRGLCAEDGPAGVEIGPEEQGLHAFLLEQKRAGRLLALVSKNVPADVEAVFAARDDLGLALSDVAARRIGWEPKPQALRELARELRLGLDSIVLLDDSAAECAEMAAALPEVAVLRRPERGVRALLDAAWPLDLRGGAPGALGEERTRLYQEEARRRAAQRAAPSFVEYLGSLDLRLSARLAGEADEARIFELAQRTNQFNTAADRPAAAEVRERVGGGRVLVIAVADRFGDYGLCGAAFLGAGGDALRVERLLLSCRVLGRGVEAEMFDALAARARELGAAALEIAFAATTRNLPARRFLEGLGGARATAGAAEVFRFPLAGLGRCPRLLGLADGREEDAPGAATAAGAAPDWTDVARQTLDPAALGRALGILPEGRAAVAAPGEAGVLAVLSEVLGRPVSRGDNLYALGADSLRLVRILARLKSRLGLDLPIAEVVHRADVAELLQLAARQPVSAAPAEDPDFLAPIRSLYDEEEPAA